MLETLMSTLAGKLAVTFFVSMVPVIELRGAIPIALAHGLDLALAVPLAVLGNLVPVPFIILFIRKVFAWLQKRSRRLSNLVDRMERRAAQKSDLVTKYKMLGLCLLVAIPLPGTGAWTGALVAAMLEMRISRALPAIALGVIIAAIIVTYVSLGAGAMLF